MNFLRSLFTRKDQRGERLYASAVAQARLPHLYSQYGVPDTIDGRFDMIVLHMCLVRQALINDGEQENDGLLLQAMDEAFIANMDDALREIGVGDLSVGKRVKDMMGAYHGRWQTYHKAFAPFDAQALVNGLERNVYRDADAPAQDCSAKAASLSAYVQDVLRDLDGQAASIRAHGDVQWSEPGS